MGVDDDGLQKAHGLVLCRALGIKHRTCRRARSQLAHHLHVLVEQGAGNEHRVVGVERNLGLTLRLRFGGGAFGDEEEAVYLPTLHGLACLGYVRIVGHDARLLKSVQIAGQLARSSGLVFVHHAHRHVLCGMFCGKPESISVVKKT